jgi:hypothetical protein
MVLGMSVQTYTLVHVIISLIGIVSGFVVMYGLLTSNRLDRWTVLFLATTAATSITGFGFPFMKLLPSHIVGILSLVTLTVVAGGWRRTYVVSATLALYFNVFVLVVESFEKVPALHALAPTQKEGPFMVAQLSVLAFFIGLGILAAKKFRSAPTQMAAAKMAA